MKKLILSILTALLLFAIPALADTGTCTISFRAETGANATYGTYKMLITGTATAAGALACTVDATNMAKLSGKFFYITTIYPGSVAPTDASDLAITDSRGLSLVTATVNGINAVDATTVTQALTEGPGIDHYQIVHEEYALTYTVTNNIVAGAIVKMESEFRDF